VASLAVYGEPGKPALPVSVITSPGSAVPLPAAGARPFLASRARASHGGLPTRALSSKSLPSTHTLRRRGERVGDGRPGPRQPRLASISRVRSPNEAAFARSTTDAEARRDGSARAGRAPHLWPRGR
jgi:hypothetical protein